MVHADFLPQQVAKYYGSKFLVVMVWLLLAGVLGCSAPLTTRETGAAVGAVGRALGLGAGAPIGDRIQALETKAIGAGHIVPILVRGD